MIVLALGLAIFLPSLSGAPLLDWDEATYAEVAHEANASHDFADFTWNGAPYVKKPPLLFWATAASFRALGESEFSARLPCALFALGTMLVLYFSGLWAAGRLVGTVAALIPLGFYFFVARGGRECATDAPLIFFSSLAMYVTLKARANRWWTCIAGAAVGLAILSKGAAGLIPAITLGIAIFVLPGFSSIGVGGLAIFVVSASVVAAPWYMHSALHNPLFWKSFVQHETLARLSAHLEDEFQPASFTIRTYLDQIAFLWPIVIGLVAALAPRAKDRIERRTLTAMLRGDTGAAVSIWTLWLAVALTAAIIVQTRLGWYILPALIPTALIAAATLGSMLLQQGA
ncbi:MAG TPA: glycosyltransferase family 39 protein, partial [Candidatus Binataceae bacterium]|nr:glycosyltransferase family 39 protein [Candidatus Binataceae bacterium]